MRGTSLRTEWLIIYRVSQKKVPLSHKKVPVSYLSCAVSKYEVLLFLRGMDLWDQGTFLGLTLIRDRSRHSWISPGFVCMAIK